LLALVGAQLFDPLIDFAEESLVTRAPLIPRRIHGHAFSAIDQENANLGFSLAFTGSSRRWADR
jgi:hypothetical protein